MTTISMASSSIVRRPMHSTASDLQSRSNPTSSDLILRPLSRPTALMFIGNSRVGKTMLLNQLGGRFQSGIGRNGVTTMVSEVLVDVAGEHLRLVDVPGLSDLRQETMQRNVELFVRTLRNGYHYKLVFVLKSSMSIIADEDLGLLYEVHRCLREANREGADDLERSEGPQVAFRIIVNLIPAGQDLYSQYLWHAEDRFRTIFRDLTRDTGVLFDIPVDEVLLLGFDEEAVRQQGFRQRLLRFIGAQRAIHVSVVGDIDVSNDLMTRIRVAVALNKGVWIGALAVIVIGSYLYIKAKISGVI